MSLKHVFIIGSRGLPARYGGFETFVEELSKSINSDNVKLHVASLASNSKYSKEKIFKYQNAEVFQFNIIKAGPITPILYDIIALRYFIKVAKKRNYDSPLFYILGNTIGGIIKYFIKSIKKVKGILIINPDGLEWKRQKWSKPVQKYLLFAEKQMIKYSTHIIADNIGIKQYLQNTYSIDNEKISFISYGSKVNHNLIKLDKISNIDWIKRKKILINQYFLVVGRFIPENNYETIIREFIRAKTTKKLVIVTNYENTKFYTFLKKKYNLDQEKRIKFVGTVYDSELLMYLRQNAFAYIHGHSVGGTNPSLLEALGTSNMNLLFDVSFNRSVAAESAVYWSSREGELANLIENVETFSCEKINAFGEKAKEIISTKYSWSTIADSYTMLFEKLEKDNASNED